MQRSLRRLHTDYIDLYYLHGWDRHTELEETMSTMNDLVRQGRVHYIGVSNWGGWQIQKAVDICRIRGWARISAAQLCFSLLTRTIEYEVVPVCAAEKITVVAWSPLAGGWLAGKYTREMTAAPEGSRLAVSEKMHSPGIDAGSSCDDGKVHAAGDGRSLISWTMMADLVF